LTMAPIIKARCTVSAQVQGRRGAESRALTIAKKAAIGDVAVVTMQANGRVSREPNQLADHEPR
jgi:hypothetical protein